MWDLDNHLQREKSPLYRLPDNEVNWDEEPDDGTTEEMDILESRGLTVRNSYFTH